MATWPLTLQQKLNTESFSEKFGETVMRTEMDIGPAKVRRRFTKSVDIITCSINLDFDEYDDFLIFFKNTVNGGATSFTFIHPISGSNINARFTEPPTITPLSGGGRKFRVSMTWETLP